MTEKTRIISNKNYLEIIEQIETQSGEKLEKVLGTQNNDIEIKNEYQSYKYNTRHKPDSIKLYFKDGSRKGFSNHQLGLTEYTVEGELIFQYHNYIFLVQGEKLEQLWLHLTNNYVSQIVEFDNTYSGDKSPNNVIVKKISSISLEQLKEINDR